MLRFRNGLFSVITLLAALSLGACGDGVGVDNQATVRVLLTDAPLHLFEAATVEIRVVELIPTDGPPIPLSGDGIGETVNLLDLQDGVTMILGEATIVPGSYTQLRLIVEGARVTLKEGFTFPNDELTMDLKVPSGAQTGIKLNLGAAVDGDGPGPLAIAPGETLLLVVDFDVSQSFVIQGNPETPAGIKGVLFTPTLRVVVEDVAGSIAGTVSTAPTTGVSVDALTVTAVPVDLETLEPFQTRIATTTTDADGTYMIRFLVPGTYTVSVTLSDGFVTEPAPLQVEVGSAEDVSRVDFAIVEKVL